MKVIRYQLRTVTTIGNEAHEFLSDVQIPYTGENLALAQAEAHLGEYTIEQTQEEYLSPSTEERLTALETAMLEMMGVSVDG